MINRDDALIGLASEVPAERLAAARYLQFWAVPADIPALRAAIQRESVSWVRRALESGLLRLGDQNSRSVDLEALVQNEAEQSADAAALARARIARTVVHELEPIAGAIRYYASQEIAKYDDSRTSLHVNRLSRILRAIETLGTISTAPRRTAIDLARVLAGVVEAERLAYRETLTVDGPRVLPIVSDADLIQLIVGNGLKNACEAALQLPDTPSVVSVLYGATDREVWVTVVDNGAGLPLGSSEQLFEMGTSTKQDHLGVGLTLASEGARALGGSIKLSSDGAGTRFELTFPLLKGKDA